jgi:hypothetical protein
MGFTYGSANIAFQFTRCDIAIFIWWSVFFSTQAVMGHPWFLLVISLHIDEVFGEFSLSYQILCVHFCFSVSFCLILPSFTFLYLGSR